MHHTHLLPQDSTLDAPNTAPRTISIPTDNIRFQVLYLILLPLDCLCRYLHFTGGEYGFYGGGGGSDYEAAGAHGGMRNRDIGVDEGQHAQRTADILT
ncbi:hypothetical protein D9611_013506 [Ephemerocybe angulata]|uniref:Uncharacterized protein n=1 Tax=Ephemerocybe angulata TaxID=980116 RepID=A0A8H5BSY5_9AGAR|nr:hypothetical protein D9611_013506 [Tulosesus angulatus]